MIAQSLISLGELFDGLAIWFFIIAMIIDIIIFFILDKYKNLKPLFNSISIIIKVFYFILGLVNVIIFLFTTIFLYIYIWIMWLKFKTSLDYDHIQIFNILFAFLSASFSRIFVSNEHIIFTIIWFVVSGLLFSIQIYTYISRKKKALKFREQAKELYNNKNYKEAWALLSKSSDFAHRMSPTRTTYFTTTLYTHIDKELEKLSKLLEQKEVSDEKIGVFTEPVLTRSDIKKHLIWFCVITSILLFVIILRF